MAKNNDNDANADDDVTAHDNTGRQERAAEEDADDDTLTVVRLVTDPRLTLPEHLQLCSFDEDVWRRVKKHPIKNGILTHRSLSDDLDTREIVRQVLAAANDREKEVLLHNQARLFSFMLTRALYSIRTFLNTSWAPRHWRSLPPNAGGAPPLPPGIRPEAGNGDRADDGADGREGEDTEGKSWTDRLKPLIVVLLTPKYVLGGIAIIFAVLAGISQIQVQNLEAAIDSYKTAATAAGAAETSFQKQLSGIQTDRERLESDKEKLLERLAVVEKEKRDAELMLASAESENRQLQARVDAQQKELTAKRREDTDELKTVRGELDTAKVKITTLSTDLAKANADKENEARRRADAEKSVNDFRVLAESRSKEIDGMRQEVVNLARTNQELRIKGTLLDFAEVFIEKMKHQVGIYFDPDENEIKEALAQYETARKNLLR